MDSPPQSKIPRTLPSHHFSETGTPYLVASCGVEPLSCGSKPPALPLSYLAVYVRFPLKLSHPGLGGDIMINHSQGSFQRDSAGAGHSCRRFFSRHYDCRLCRMEGATLSGPKGGLASTVRHIFPAALQAAIACSGDMDQDHCHAGIGTGGRLCSPNLRFWRPALSIELHPYIV